MPQIAKIREEEEDFPVPILAFPAFGAAVEGLGNPAHDTLLSRARALRAEGYDTVVAAPFGDAEAFGWALKQADEFKPTFLLFVETLEEIALYVAERSPLRWTRTPGLQDCCTLSVEKDGKIDDQDWICLRQSGELALRGRNKPRLYELAIALRRDEQNAPGYLHSYFPTSIPLPFAALFHATLELDSNRKAIKQNSELNQRVLAELAAFYAVSLARLAKSRQIGQLLDFLHRDQPFPEPLKAFEDAVYRAIRPLAVIPTMRGGRVRVGDAKLGPAGYQSYLPGRVFGDLAKCRGDKDRGVLDRLGVETLSPPGIVQTLRRSELSLEERARAIVGIAANLNAKFHDRSLFLDQTGKPMQGKNTLFPPPASGESLPRLPDWAKARFIDPGLWKLTLAKTEGQNPRDKLRRLSGYGISEYSNESVIASLRSQALRALREKRRDPDVVKCELLRAVHAFYVPEHRRPPGTFMVRCSDGIWREASQVHLSETYGQAGAINAALYRTAPANLLAPAAENGLDDVPANRAAFFEWIGVHRWPRAGPVPVPTDLRDVVKFALPDTITVEDGNSHQSFGKSEISWGYNFSAQCELIVGLREMLATAESDAILAWLAFDPRFDLSAPHHFETSAHGRKDGKANFRAYPDPLPDLVRERITAMPWLACKDGSPHPPRSAMAEPGSLAELFHVPRAPALGSEERYELTQHFWRRGLEHAQVPRGLSDLSEARIFILLRTLSDDPPSEATTRAFYNQVLALDSFDADKAPAEHSDFLAKGKVQVHRSRNREWVRPADALYADQTGLPVAVREALALIDLPARRNTGNVLQRFGVAALSKRNYDLEITRLVEETGAPAAMLRADLAATRPYIRALRLADANLTQRLRRFDRLTLTIASIAEIAVSLGEQRISGSLEPWTHVLYDDTLIVAIDACQQPGKITALAHEAIADGIAELFDLQSGSDFAKLLSAQDDGLRRILLRRMLANLSEGEIEALLADIPAPEEPYEPVKMDPETLARGPAPAVTPAPSPPPVSPPPGSPGMPTPGRHENPGAVTSTPLSPGSIAPPWQPTTAPSIRLRVSRATGPLGTTAHPDPYRAADAEEWTRLFEISQGRFPLAVLHLQGHDAYGCDWLSFATETDRAAFLLDPSRTDLVARFIETKSGTIELSDNQSRAAERRQARFFIYRMHFYPGQRDSAELTIASNPLAHRQALSARYEFRIDAVEGRELYQLVPEVPSPASGAPAEESESG